MGKSGRHREAEEGGVEKKMVHLPNELIIQILMRLPVKSLLRFRCVSKSWFSLISDPHFATSHFELAAASTFRILYLPTSAFTSQTRSIDLDAASLDTDSASATLNLSFLPPTSYSKIMGSCRGFLLLSHGSHLYLWNPSTGIHKQLPLSCFMSRNANFLFFTFLYGFGYDPSTDDYLVLLASYDLASDLETYFELFSLKANAWKRIEGTHLSYMNAFDDPRAGTLLNGVIHWLAFRYDVSVDVIVAFDLMERSFSEVPLPDDFNQDFNFCDLCVLGGFLTLCVRGDDTIDIWVMREYKVQSSWTKSIVVSYSDLLPTLYFSPICFTESGDIVGMDGSTRLVKFNAKGQLLQHRSYCDDPHGCEAAMYTESILSLPYDSGQPAADD